MAEITCSFDEKGLIAAVVQDYLSGRVLMVAYMNAEALERTRQTGEAHFYSRSRRTLWKKGEGSGNVMRVRQMVVDCDADTVLLQVDPAGPACHTGASACFFRDEHGEPIRAGTEIERLEERILERQTSTAERSYTRSLLDGGAPRIGLKIREEADELARAIASETEERVAAEASDLLYHALVGLALRGVSFQTVLGALARRAGVSGLAEKAGRQGA